MPTNRFESWDEVALWVSQFESGELPHANWNLFLKERGEGRSDLELANELVEAYAHRSGLWRD